MSDIELITGRTGEQHVLAIDDAEIYRTLLGNGDFVLSTGQKFNATMNGANKVDIYNGTLIMQGRQIKIRSGYQEVETAGGVTGYKREDAIVVEYSKTDDIETAVLKVVKGANNADLYKLPTLTTGDIDAGETHQMLLWSVRYNGINFDSLVDHRAILDTTPIQTAIDLANSYQAQIKNQMTSLQEEVAEYVANTFSGLEDAAQNFESSITGIWNFETSQFEAVSSVAEENGVASTSLTYKGMITSGALSDGSTESSITILPSTSITASSGDVVYDGTNEYLYDGSTWHMLDGDNRYWGCGTITTSSSFTYKTGDIALVDINGLALHSGYKISQSDTTLRVLYDPAEHDLTSGTDTIGLTVLKATK